MSVCDNVADFGRGIFNSSAVCLYPDIMFEYLPEWLLGNGNLSWFCAMIGSLLVGLSGVLPLLVIPIDETDNLKQGGENLS